MKIKPSIGEYYHIYNRGTDKREVFLCEEDRERFFLSMQEFNSVNPIGSIYEKGFRRSLGGSTSKPDSLVEFVAYCLNPNHYHFILKQVAENGVAVFMQRIGTGYTMYFNEKYQRSGALFQGRYKVKHVSTNEYLLHLSAYVNLNFEVHELGGSTSKSSWEEYLKKVEKPFCIKDIILGQFPTVFAYESYARNALKDILKRRWEEKELDKLLLE